jgi:HAD superfamily hydrolase (TIGR01509 family)
VSHGFEALPRPVALVFDLDGTLVDTVGARIDGWLAAFAEEGVPAEPGQIAPLIGSDGRRLGRVVAEASGRRLTADEEERLDARAGELYDTYNVEPRPHLGARDLLVALSDAGVPWAIATSSRAAQVHVSVSALHLPDPPTIIDGSSVTHAKPDPELLLVTASRLGVAPTDCWYVGDATWDMLASRAAGMTAIGVTSGAAETAALEEAGADVVVPTLIELHDALAAAGALWR